MLLDITIFVTQVNHFKRLGKKINKQEKSNKLNELLGLGTALMQLVFVKNSSSSLPIWLICLCDCMLFVTRARQVDEFKSTDSHHHVPDIGLKRQTSLRR